MHITHELMYSKFLDQNLQKVRKYRWPIGTRLGALICSDTCDELNLLEEFLRPPALYLTVFRHAHLYNIRIFHFCRGILVLGDMFGFLAPPRVM